MKKRGPKFTVDHQARFREIKKHVENGFTICQALERMGLNRTNVYKNFTLEQKKELRTLSILNSKNSPSQKGGRGPSINPDYIDGIFLLNDDQDEE